MDEGEALWDEADAVQDAWEEAAAGAAASGAPAVEGVARLVEGLCHSSHFEQHWLGRCVATLEAQVSAY